MTSEELGVRESTILRTKTRGKKEPTEKQRASTIAGVRQILVYG
jgi:hypothetical protein